MAKFKVVFSTKFKNAWSGCYMTLNMPASTKVKSFFESKIEEHNAMYTDRKVTENPNYKREIDANKEATEVFFNYKFLKNLGFEGPFTKKKATVNLTNETTLEDLLASQRYGDRVLTPNDLTENQACFEVHFK